LTKEAAGGSVIQDRQPRNADRPRRWDRTQRAELFDPYLDLEAQGFSLRQAAQALEVPRSTLGAERAHHESLDAHPAVAAFVHSAPGLAFVHRLVFAIHLVGTEVGACGIRLGCLLGQLTGRDRFVAASYGAQQQIHRQVEEAMVAYRRPAQARSAQEMPAKAIPWAYRDLYERAKAFGIIFNY
jgi:hypothetical protein